MSKAKLLVAACAMVLGVSEIGAMVSQQIQMNQQNHNKMIQIYVKRLEADFRRGNGAWLETMNEAKENGILDKVLTQRYMLGTNALSHAIACEVNFAGNPWEVWGSPKIRGALLTQTTHSIIPIPDNLNALGLALYFNYDNNTIFQLLKNAKDAGVLDTVLLHQEAPTETTFLSFITHYRSKSLIEQIIQMVRDTNPALLRQLITDQVINKARQIESPVLPLLEQTKRGIDGII